MSGRPTGEPRLAAGASWAVLAASFGLSASTWINLATLAGFTETVGWVRLAWLMPVAVDGYVVVALVLWMSPVPARVAKFAKVNTYAAASVGVAAQSAFHAFLIHDQTGSEWRTVLAAIVGALPPAGAALSVHMRALIRRESRNVSPDVGPDTVADLTPDVPDPLPQVTAHVRADAETTAAEPGDAPRSPVKAPPKRPFATTQRAAAAMQADGMSVPQIAEALGITERQARRALRPVAVDSNQPEGR